MMADFKKILDLLRKKLRLSKRKGQLQPIPVIIQNPGWNGNRNRL